MFLIPDLEEAVPPLVPNSASEYRSQRAGGYSESVDLPATSQASCDRGTKRKRAIKRFTAAAIRLTERGGGGGALQTLSRLLRCIPPGVRGKARLARALLPDAARSEAALVRNRDGSPMIVPSLLEPVGLCLWMDGVYEPETLRFLRQHTAPDSVFVDVDANIGAFAVPLAKHTGRVIAIEASPQVVPYLRKNVALNDLSNVEIIPCAASRPGCDSVPLYVPPVRHFGMASSSPQFCVEPISIPAVSIDSVVQNARVSAMKVDTEGYEAHVFLGARQLLGSRYAPVIVFEFCDWAEERAFPGKKGWAQSILMETGYKLWTMESYVNNGAPLKEPVTEGFHSIVGISS
jgi:FkbM family methyltransferase